MTSIYGVYQRREKKKEKERKNGSTRTGREIAIRYRSSRVIIRELRGVRDK